MCVAAKQTALNAFRALSLSACMLAALSPLSGVDSLALFLVCSACARVVASLLRLHSAVGMSASFTHNTEYMSAYGSDLNSLHRRMHRIAYAYVCGGAYTCMLYVGCRVMFVCLLVRPFLRRPCSPGNPIAHTRTNMHILALSAHFFYSCTEVYGREEQLMSDKDIHIQSVTETGRWWEGESGIWFPGGFRMLRFNKYCTYGVAEYRSQSFASQHSNAHAETEPRAIECDAK